MYNTGNPLGSTDPRDLSDNSEVFDELVNNLTDPTVPDRFGNPRVTLANQVGFRGTGVDNAIEDYSAGIELTTYNTIIRYDGEFYSPSATATLPYTTTATLPDVDSNLVARGDAALRQDLLQSTGADQVNTDTGESVQTELDSRVIRVESVAEIEALTLSDGDQVNLSGLRGGPFRFDSSDMSTEVAADPQQGVYIAPSSDPTGASGASVRQEIDFSNIRGEWFGVKVDNSTDDYAALQAAVDWAAQAVDGGQGAIVKLKTGVCLLSQTIDGPNRVAISGPNGRGLVFRPFAGFSDSYMFHFVNGTNSMFGSRLEHCYVDGRGFNMTALILSDAWQETCGLRDTVLQFDGTTQYGLLYQNGFGGAAYLPLVDIEIFSDSTAVSQAGIKVSTISAVGGFVLDIHGATMAGTTTNPIPAGVIMDNDSLALKGFHVEYCDSAVTMAGAGSLSVDTITGSANDVVDLITLGSGFTGKVSARSIIPNGATGQSIKNNITGNNIPASFGMLADYSYPSTYSENTALAWVAFNGSDGSILDSFNVDSVTRSSTGQYVVNYSNALPSNERCISWSTNVDSVDAVVVTATGSTSTTDQIKVRRLGSFAGAYYDAQKVRVTVFGNSVV